MAWETRNGRGRYYTRSRRSGGQVIRQYIGTGEVAQAIADLDALDREQRREVAEAFRAECVRLDAVDAPTRAFCEACELLTHGALLVAGYHRHHRGEWRRRRNGHEAAATAA